MGAKYNFAIKRSLPFNQGHVRDLVEIVVLALGLYLLATTTIVAVRVVGSSMYPSLRDGDLLIASRIDTQAHPIQRGDIVILKDPLNPSEEFIKRVIGLPGDDIRIHNHRVYVNGELLTEPYLIAPWAQTGDWPGPGPNDSATVPASSYFVLGDNRDHSSDSRVFRWVTANEIDGRAIARFWPLPQAALFLARPSLAS